LSLEKQKIYYDKKYNFTDIDWFSPNIPIWDKILNQPFFKKEKIDYLEIGTYEGRSAIHICENFKNFNVTVVDPFIEYSEVGNIVKTQIWKKYLKDLRKIH